MDFKDYFQQILDSFKHIYGLFWENIFITDVCYCPESARVAFTVTPT